MKTHTHTPGPWELHGCTVSTLTRWEDGNKIGGGLVAVSYDPFRDECPSDEQAANARLIAAAPCLLSALEALVGQADLGEVDLEPEEREKLENARLAIAKATGKEQQ
jgi:hypothetical protein